MREKGGPRGSRDGCVKSGGKEVAVRWHAGAGGWARGTVGTRARNHGLDCD